MELIQNKKGLVATLTVKVSQEDYAAKVEKELRKRRQMSQVKGFRLGNAPMSLIKKMYGMPLMVEEVNKLVLESIKNYEQQNAGRLFAQVIPSDENQILMNFEEQTDFEFVYEAGFYPEFTYKIDENTELPYYNITIGDNDVDDEIETYREMYDTSESRDTIEDNCLIGVNVDLVKDGEDITCSTSFLIALVPDEHKQVFLGAKINDTVNVEIRKVFINEVDLMGMLKVNKDELDLLPETLPFTITNIIKKTPAEINQDLFDKVAGKDKVHSEEELREYSRNAIISDYKVMSLDKLYKDSIEVLLEKANIDMPEAFIEKYIRFLQKEGNEISDENLKSTVEYFARETKWKYIMYSLLSDNEVHVTNDMFKEEIKLIFRENYPQFCNNYTEEEFNELVNAYRQNTEYSQEVVNRIRGKQLASLLKEKAKLNVIDVTIEEFMKTYYNNTATNDNAITEETPKDETSVESPETVSTETAVQENNNEKIQS
jgi:trigger factor